MSTPLQIVLVTGATSGIGLATASELLRRGVRVLVHGRTQKRAEATAQRLLEQHLDANVRAVWGDLTSLAEVRALAAQAMEEPRLDVLLHNAGVERWEREETQDGFEQTLAVNHLAPFLLTRLLTPLLTRSAPARVIFVSSMVHGWGEIHWDDLNALGWYSPEPVYYQSKLAAALTAQSFSGRLAPLGISVLLAPPGLTQTSFSRDFRGMARLWSRWVGPLLFRQPGDVAMEFTSVCLDERFASVSGAYIDRLSIGLPAERALVVADQQRLWDWTCAQLQLPTDDPPPGALPPLTFPRPHLGPWVGAVMFGELLGFSLTALVAFIALTLGGRPETTSDRVIALCVMVLAGTIEGASLGYFQWRVLRRWLPRLPAKGFVAATVGVAAGGWFFGMSVPLLMSLRGVQPGEPAGEGPGTLGVLAFAAVFGGLAGALFGVAQGIALRRHTRGVVWWVLGSAVGWAFGLPIAYFAGSLGTETMTWWQALGLSGAAGLGMGLCVGVGTFAALRRMAAREREV